MFSTTYISLLSRIPCVQLVDPQMIRTFVEDVVMLIFERLLTEGL